ncbi:MAG: 3-hydroxyacyl-CoA dehydrogenase family protein [Thalassovita sp.]
MLIPLLSDLPKDQIADARLYAEALVKSPKPKTVPVSAITVVGGAAAGLGVAVSLARSGSAVTYLEDDASSLERAEFYLSRMLQGDTAPEFLGFSSDVGGVATSVAVLDMTTETLAEKHARLARLSSVMTPSALLITNLSGPYLADVAARLVAPDRVLGAQLFFPMAQGHIAELAVHTGTSADARDRAEILLRQMAKQPVQCGTGLFVSERLQMRMLEAADTLLMDGATPWEVDEALEAFGYRMGLYEAQDLIGTDVAYSIRKRTVRPPGRRYVPIADRAVEEGRLGKKASVGWYRYPGGEGKVIDPLVEDLCREEAHFAGVIPRHITEDELREHLLLALINEAAWAINQGCLAADVDVLSVQALGFPAEHGGVMHFAEILGAKTIANALQALAEEEPITWEIAPLLLEAAENGTPLKQG